MNENLPEWLQDVLRKANEIAAILVVQAAHNSRRHATGKTGAHGQHNLRSGTDREQKNNLDSVS